MTLPICRLCFNTTEEKDVDFIDDNIKEILQIVLIKIDLTIIENPVICSTCRRRLEQNYGFKMKCVFTENSITPFVAEHVKINLNEVCTQIIKSEETDNDKNVCRLCLKFSENDMCLNEAERTQFLKWFPEVNLNLTNFVVLCPTCYDSLQKYFIFITSRVESEQQLCNYSLDLKEENGIINLEQFQQYSRDIDQCLDEKNISLLNEELDIKCEADIEDERSVNMHPYQLDSSNINREGDNMQLEKFHLVCDTDGLATTEISNKKKYKCVKCNYASELTNDIKSHFSLKHSNFSKKLKIFGCENCDIKVGSKIALKDHIAQNHKLVQYKCYKCDYTTVLESHLKRHTIYKHSVHPSEVKIYKCKECNFESVLESHLKRHMLNQHLIRYKCIHCYYKSIVYQCERCDFKSLLKSHLRRHILDKHDGQYSNKTYNCEQCPYESNLKADLLIHLQLKHNSQVESYSCVDCRCVFTDKGLLQLHIQTEHTRLVYTCAECNSEFAFKRLLHQHIRRCRTTKAEPRSASVIAKHAKIT